MLLDSFLVFALHLGLRPDVFGADFRFRVLSGFHTGDLPLSSAATLSATTSPSNGDVSVPFSSAFGLTFRAGTAAGFFVGVAETGVVSSAVAVFLAACDADLCEDAIVVFFAGAVSAATDWELKLTVFVPRSLFKCCYVKSLLRKIPDLSRICLAIKCPDRLLNLDFGACCRG